MLRDILIKSPEQKILSFFVMNPDRAFYGREISGKLGMSAGAVHAALSSLEKAGLLIPQFAGKTKLYHLAEPDAITTTFRILNTLLVLDPLIRSIKDSSRRIVLFGSYATGTFTDSSDLDLLIVSREKEKVAAKIGSFQRKSGLDVRPIIKGQAEWAELERKSPEFFEELSRGIALWEKPVDESGF